MVPVTITSTYLVLGHNLVIIPFHNPLLHSAPIKSASLEFGLRIFKTASFTDASVIVESTAPVRNLNANDSFVLTKVTEQLRVHHVHALVRI